MQEGDWVNFQSRGNPKCGILAEISRGVYFIVQLHNKAVWRINPKKSRVTKRRGPTTLSPEEALEKAKKILDSTRERKSEKHKKQADENFCIAADRNLTGLDAGDPIWVKFKGGGWLQASFSHFSESGRIGFRFKGKKRFADPILVRRR